MTTRVERARDILRPVCRCHEAGGTYCRVHDTESTVPRAGDTARLIREDPREACYEDCFQLGYLNRPIPQALREFTVVQIVRGRPTQTRPFEDAWLSGHEWRGRDNVWQRRRAARMSAPRRRRRGGRRGFLRSFIRRIG